MTALAALLLLASAASAFSPLLTVAGAWAALALLLLALARAWWERPGSVHISPRPLGPRPQPAPPPPVVPDVVIAKIQRHRVIRVHPKNKEYRP